MFLLTGGSGFFGEHLAEFLVAKGEQVRSLDLLPPALPVREGFEHVEPKWFRYVGKDGHDKRLARDRNPNAKGSFPRTVRIKKIRDKEVASKATR